MHLITKLIFLCLLILTANCGGTSEEDQKLLEEAASIHQQAIEIEEKIKPKMEALIQRKNQINIQGRALTDAEIAFVEKVEQLQTSYDYWEENHVEVPGFEHDHHGHEGHDHDHDHDHGNQLKVTAADMLLIQKEFRDSISAIQQKVEKLKMPEGFNHD